MTPAALGEALITLSAVVLVGVGLAWLVNREGGAGYIAVLFAALGVIGLAVLLSA